MKINYKEKSVVEKTRFTTREMFASHVGKIFKWETFPSWYIIPLQSACGSKSLLYIPSANNNLGRMHSIHIPDDTINSNPERYIMVENMELSVDFG